MEEEIFTINFVERRTINENIFLSSEKNKVISRESHSLSNKHDSILSPEQLMLASQFLL